MATGKDIGLFKRKIRSTLKQMIKEFEEEGIKENMGSGYIHMLTDDLSKLRLGYKEESDWKEEVRRSVDAYADRMFKHGTTLHWNKEQRRALAEELLEELSEDSFDI